MLEMRKMMQPHSGRFILQSLDKSVVLVKLLSPLLNLFLKPIIYICSIKCKRAIIGFTIKEECMVPEWVNDIVLNDGHKYMEVHDNKWLQWCLDNKFHGEDGNVNRFYSVFRQGEPMGFFMIKERVVLNEQRSYSPLLYGTVVEWGTKDDSVLSEIMLDKMAVCQFSKQVDVIRVATDNDKTSKQLSKLLFRQHGNSYIAFKDLKKVYSDASNPSLWRLRFGYADSIFN